MCRENSLLQSLMSKRFKSPGQALWLKTKNPSKLLKNCWQQLKVGTNFNLAGAYFNIWTGFWGILVESRKVLNSNKISRVWNLKVLINVSPSTLWVKLIPQSENIQQKSGLSFVYSIHFIKDQFKRIKKKNSIFIVYIYDWVH